MIKQSTQSLGFDDRWFRIIGIPFVGLIVPAIFFRKPFGFYDEYFISVGFSIFYTALYWHLCRAFFIWGNKKYPNAEQYSKRLTQILVLCFLTMFILCNTLHICLEDYLFLPNKLSPPNRYQINASSFFCFLMIAGMYESMRYVMLWKKTTVENEQLQRENLQSQLAGLKSQVNPHFLFNSLNTLVHLIPENPDSAVKFVQKLSKVYRYILEMRDASTTPLSTELEFLNAYIFLLKERFGDNLQVNVNDSICKETVFFDNKEVCEKHIVPLSLQILFENAIKHNIISTQRPLTITVSIENNERLVVKNNLQRKNQIQEGTGVGLQNIRNRYQLVCQKEVDIIVTPESFIVSLPLLVIE